MPRRNSWLTVGKWTLLGVSMIAIAYGYSYRVGRLVRFEPVNVRVLEYLTLKPIEGAVVAARWQFNGAFNIHSGHSPGEEAATAEGITDSSGIAVLFPPPARRKGNHSISEHSPIVFGHKAGYVVLSKWSDRPGLVTFTVISPDTFADGAKLFAAGAGAVRDDIWSRGPQVRLPHIEREIRRGYSLLTPELQRAVQEHLGESGRWLIAPPAETVN